MIEYIILSFLKSYAMSALLAGCAIMAYVDKNDVNKSFLRS